MRTDRVVCKKGASYFKIFIARTSKWIFVYQTILKLAVFDCFQKPLYFSERKTRRKLKSVQSENGGEYAGNKFLSLTEVRGIVARRSRAYLLQQNSVAERMN